MTLHRAYVDEVLAHNFEDARALFLDPLLAIHRAHLVMLAECGIVSAADARVLREAIEDLPLDALRRQVYDGSAEDLFFVVERMLAEACGEDVAGRLHTARSRNDIDMTMYRMRLREAVAALLGATLDLRGTLLDLAGQHRDTVFAAHTHTQPAQPTTVAHYLLAVIEQLERDAGRLRAAFDTVNRCPLGACAITGTGFPIDRQATSDLLGFAAPTGNTYGSIATADYLLEAASSAAVLLVGIGRVVQDLLLWCTSEFGYLRLSDGFVQCSSIMPQKRNPVALEHARALVSKAAAQASALLMAVHNTPFGDIVDTEDDLQPLAASAFRDARRGIAVLAAALGEAHVDGDRMGARAASGATTSTELADHLVRAHGLSFRAAHAVAGGVMRRAAGAGRPPCAADLAAISGEVTGTRLEWEEDALADVLSAHHFVAVRTTPGGPAPGETARAIAASRARLDDDRGWLDAARAAVAEAGARRAARVAGL